MLSLISNSNRAKAIITKSFYNSTVLMYCMISVFYCTSLVAQNSAVRQWSLSWPSGTNALSGSTGCIQAITQASDGGYVGVGYINVNGQSLQPSAIKVDAQGKKLWEKVLDDNNTAIGILYDVIPVPNSTDVIGIGFKNGLVVFRLKQNGTIAAGFPKYFNATNMTGLGTFNPIGLSIRPFYVGGVHAGYIMCGDLFSCGTFGDQYQSAGGLVIKTDVNFNLDANFKSHANTAGWGKYNFGSNLFSFSDDRAAARCVRPINDASGNVTSFIITGQVYDSPCVCGTPGGGCGTTAPPLNVFTARINLNGTVNWKTSLDETTIAGYNDIGPDTICTTNGLPVENSSQIGFAAEQRTNGSNEIIILAGMDWTQSTLKSCSFVTGKLHNQTFCDLALFTINANAGGAVLANRKMNVGFCEGIEFRPSMLIDRCTNNLFVSANHHGNNNVFTRIFKIDISKNTFTRTWTKDAMGDEYSTISINNTFCMALAKDGGLVVAGCNESNTEGNFMLRLANDCQMNTVYDVDGLIINSGTVVWNTNKKVRGTIRIQNGGKLVINANAQIEFADTRQTVDFELLHLNPGNLPTKIIVEPGARLVINGTAGTPKTTLTGLTSCYNCNSGANYNSEMWEGIEVWGNPNLAQTFNATNTNQGYLNIYGNAVLQNMFKGISVDKTNYAAYPDTRTNTGYPANTGRNGGGVVQVTSASGAKFYNNIFSVVCSPFYGSNVNFTSLSNCSFNAAEFTNNAAMRDLNYVDSVGKPLGVNTHMFVDNAKSITLTNCIFKGFATNALKQRGKGIYTNDATINCTSNNLITNFANLTYGIFANQSSASNQILNVSGNKFNNCYRSIVTRGTRNDNIRSNTISIPNNTNSNVGINTWGSGNFSFDANNFTGATLPLSTTKSYGLLLHNTGSFASNAGGNNFTNLNIGTQTQKNCGTAATNNGMQLFCNTYTNMLNSAWFIAPFNAGTLANQGQGCAATNKQARNIFIDPHNCISGAEVHIKSKAAFTYYNGNCVNCKPDCKSALVTTANCGNDNASSCMLVNWPTTQAFADSIETLMGNTSNNQIKGTYRNTLVQYYLTKNDQTNAARILETDSLSDNTKKILIAFYVGQRNWTKAQSKINQLTGAAGSDNDAYKIYFQLIKNVLAAGKSLQQLSAAEINTVDSIATHESTASYNAQALLETYYSYKYPMYVETTTGVEYKNGIAVNASSTLIHLFPNPANDLVTVQWDGNATTLMITDVNGRIITALNIDEEEHQKAIATNDIDAGIYFVTVFLSDGQQLVTKLVVSR